MEHKLTLWRKAKQLTQAQAGELIAVSSVAWGRYEAGRVPERDILQRIIVVTGGEVTANDWFDVPPGQEDAPNSVVAP